MDATKIRLSATEMRLIKDAEVILTKNIILKKVAVMLNAVQTELQSAVAHNKVLINEKIFEVYPKISKGENYEGLPYLVLDYPRVFEHQNIFIIRCMFWWGNFFSCTLQLGGLYKLKYQQLIIDHYSSFANKNFFIGINEDPWQHHFNSENYKPVKELSKEAFITVYENLPQIKIAAKWPLETWTDAANNFKETWWFFINMIKLNYLNGEKDL